MNTRASTAYNDPFYFAFPRHAVINMDGARKHIREVFGIDGVPEVVSVEDTHTLCRLTGIERVSA